MPRTATRWPPRCTPHAATQGEKPGPGEVFARLSPPRASETDPPGPAGTMAPMPTHAIRIFGDPVLKRPAAPVDEIDGSTVKLVDAMLETMYEAPGVGLAATQVGVQQRFFVYDIGEGPNVLFNPEIVEATGEWLRSEERRVG